MDTNNDTRYNMNTDTKKQVATLPYQPEFLNSITQVSIPPYILKVKRGAPLMLLRNINPRYGMCNGTRMLCRDLFKNMLNVEILTGSNARKRAFLPIIKLKTNASSRLPFVLSRKQFSVRLSFVITINKSQGHTISNF
ncbi:PIF1-like helicase [Medicago truncatula]|uniref:PIF1-like helicase n=1 Tax=Medicago truncatula TaxID=3880 RepID=G7J2P7_MEDTR|nr:PIF1-like helicase [Medicago truncatula]